MLVSALILDSLAHTVIILSSSTVYHLPTIMLLQLTFTGVQIPPLLSTMIPAEEAKSMHAPNVQYEMHDPTEEAELMAQIDTHNQNMGGVVDNFNQLMEQWRAEKDSKVKVKSGLA